jgi:hypothetical protein
MQGQTTKAKERYSNRYRGGARQVPSTAWPQLSVFTSATWPQLGFFNSQLGYNFASSIHSY